MSFGRVGCTLRAVGVRQSSFLGLTVDEEMTEHGPWFSVSVFWSPDVPVSRLPTRINELIRHYRAYLPLCERTDQARWHSCRRTQERALLDVG
jgi:hypothetical protein